MIKTRFGDIAIGDDFMFNGTQFVKVSVRMAAVNEGAKRKFFFKASELVKVEA